MAFITSSDMFVDHVHVWRRAQLQEWGLTHLPTFEGDYGLLLAVNKTTSTREFPGSCGNLEESPAYVSIDQFKKFVEACEESPKPYVMIHGGLTVEPFIRLVLELDVAPSLGKMPVALATPLGNLDKDKKMNAENLEKLKSELGISVLLVHAGDGSKRGFMQNPQARFTCLASGGQGVKRRKIGNEVNAGSKDEKGGS